MMPKSNQRYIDKIYCRGFFFSSNIPSIKELLLYKEWNIYKICNYILAVHPKQQCFTDSYVNTHILLLVHAYDPIDSIKEEQDIIHRLLQLRHRNKKQFWDKFNNITGIFTLIYIDGDSICLLGDPSGMQTVFYTMNREGFFVSSHCNLIGEVFDLKWDPYVKRLVNYRFFPLFGNSLPGDITQFKKVKRLVPNHYIKFEGTRRIRVGRFYTPHILEKSEDELIKEAAEILHSSIELISKKWDKPAISLTGGCDSKTTVACAVGLYEKFTYFSYISNKSEQVDALAAHKICNSIGLEHTIYEIPEEDGKFDNISEVRDILFLNTGGILRSHPNDVRKRAYFADKEDFDVEVKSWASEIGRAYYSKRFHGRTDFGDAPTPRKCTTLYKFFLHDRQLVRQTDQVFAQYLKRYFKQDAEHPVPWQEQFFWEFRVPSWNGLVITGEHQYSYDITIPYNNRKLLNILLSAPIEEKINDVMYSKIREYMNPEVDKTGISVTNLLHTKKREALEDIYYRMNTLMPF